MNDSQPVISKLFLGEQPVAAPHPVEVPSININDEIINSNISELIYMCDNETKKKANHYAYMIIQLLYFLKKGGMLTREKLMSSLPPRAQEIYNKIMGERVDATGYSGPGEVYTNIGDPINNNIVGVKSTLGFFKKGEIVKINKKINNKTSYDIIVEGYSDEESHTPRPVAEAKKRLLKNVHPQNIVWDLTNFGKRYIIVRSDVRINDNVNIIYDEETDSLTEYSNIPQALKNKANKISSLRKELNSLRIELDSLRIELDSLQDDQQKKTQLQNQIINKQDQIRAEKGVPFELLRGVVVAIKKQGEGNIYTVNLDLNAGGENIHIKTKKVQFVVPFLTSTEYGNNNTLQRIENIFLDLYERMMFKKITIETNEKLQKIYNERDLHQLMEASKKARELDHQTTQTKERFNNALQQMESNKEDELDEALAEHIPIKSPDSFFHRNLAEAAGIKNITDHIYSIRKNFINEEQKKKIYTDILNGIQERDGIPPEEIVPSGDQIQVSLDQKTNMCVAMEDFIKKVPGGFTYSKLKCKYNGGKKLKKKSRKRNRRRKKRKVKRKTKRKKTKNRLYKRMRKKTRKRLRKTKRK